MNFRTLVRLAGLPLAVAASTVAAVGVADAAAALGHVVPASAAGNHSFVVSYQQVAPTMAVSGSSDDLPPAYAGVAYIGQGGPASSYTPQFSGPVSTPKNPNPPTQYVHITAGTAGATVATSMTFGSPRWSSPWVLGAGQSAVIPAQNWMMVGIAGVPDGPSGSFSVTAITAS